MQFPYDDALDYPIDGLPYQGHFISPGAEAPLVLLAHAWGGVTQAEIGQARKVAALGYAVLAVDLFGKGIRPTDNAGRQAQISALYADRAQLRARMAGAVSALQALGCQTQRLVLAGYCFGGAAVLEAARAGQPALGYVSFHGNLNLPAGQDYQLTRAPVLICHGSADTLVSLAQFAALGVALEQAGVPHELISYGGAPHGFTQEGTERYHPRAAEQAWQRFTAFLAEVFG